MGTSAIFGVLMMVSLVNAGTILSVNLVSLYTPNNEVYTTNNSLLCCNNAVKVNNRCRDPCNAVLQVCYRPTKHDPCQQTQTSTRIQGQLSIHFTSSIGNLSNPVTFQMQQWTIYSGFTVKAFEDIEQTRSSGIFDLFPYLTRVDTSLNTARVHEKTSFQDHKTHASLHITYKVYHLCSPDSATNRVCDSHGNLVCASHYYGQHCDRRCEPTRNGHCDRYGTLVCNPSYYGRLCERQCITPQSHGHCDSNGTVSCDSSYYGLNCNKQCITPSSNGHCDSNGTLRCDQYYYGPNCDTKCIPPPSNGHCDTNGYLRCDPPFVGSSCNESSATIPQAVTGFTLKITLRTLYIPACPCTTPSSTCLPVCHPAAQICFRKSSLNLCSKTIKSTTDYSGKRNTTFGSTVGNLTNPILLHFQTWSPRYRFQVVFYGDGQASHLIGSFLVTQFLSNTSIITEGQDVRQVTKTYYNTGAVLTFDFEVFRVLCTPQPEQNRVCNQDGRLVCETDHYGPHCTRICVPTDHGTCDNLGHLICNNSYYGPKCDVHCVPIGHKICDNNGTLRCQPNYYGTQCGVHCVSTMPRICDDHGQLQCANNYYGPSCNVHCVAIDNKNCTSTGKSVCKDFFHGHNCESRCTTSIMTHFIRNNEGTLICTKDYYGPCCNQVCPHLQHGHCNGTHLVCDTGYFGSTCATHCLPTDHGNCDVSGQLVCDHNFYGFSCNVSCMPTGHKVCDNNGTLHCDSNYYGPSCDVYCSVPDDHGTCDNTGRPQCRQAYYGPSCNLSCPVQSNGHRSCVVTDLLCTSQPCLNHGTCTENGNTYQCHCPFEYVGTNCEMLNVCAYSPCRNGQCTTTTAGFHCSCEPGWTGFTCETDINECDRSVCPSGHKCINNFGSYTCLSCEHTVCQNNGTCIYQDLDHEPMCKCEQGWTGPDCSVTDACLDNPCGHFKRCEAFSDGYYCHYVHDVCSRMPCKNGGVCQQDGHMFTCRCPIGFKGDMCDELDSCASHPCLNGGTCTNNSTAYICTCASGWMGNTCNIADHCLSGPCNSNSACVNGHLSYTCVCLDGWRGHDCMTKEFCINNPCYSGSTCLPSNTSFICKCLRR